MIGTRIRRSGRSIFRSLRTFPIDASMQGTRLKEVFYLSGLLTFYQLMRNLRLERRSLKSLWRK
jgi:hypothetical protein